MGYTQNDSCMGRGTRILPKSVVVESVLWIDILGTSGEIAPRWMLPNPDMSTLVQVMAWCQQATSHFMNQCWPRSLLPYCVIRSQWFNGCNAIYIYIYLLFKSVLWLLVAWRPFGSRAFILTLAGQCISAVPSVINPKIDAYHLTPLMRLVNVAQKF